MCENEKRRSISLGFTEERVLEGQHICYIYNDDAERLRVIAKYLESGMLEKEKLLYLVDVMTPREMMECLEDLGVDVRSASRDLTVSEAESTYRPSGAFNTEEMLGLTHDFQQQALREGYTGSRGAGEMSWCLVDGRVSEDDLLEYEARLNLFLAENPSYTTCCQYDARRFDGSTIMDVLSVHPVMIVRGQLVKNPYYIDARTFLEEYRARGNGA